MSDKNLPNEIADYLIAKIYVGDLKPGQKLPSERNLSELLGVNRTSLRMALRQLDRMRLIESRPRSGILIRDFRASAGMDFIDAVLRNPDIEQGAAILLESTTLWVEYIPRVFFEANLSSGSGMLLELHSIVEEQMAEAAGAANLQTLTELEMRMQDVLVSNQSSILIATLMNSVRSMIQAVIYQSFATVDPTTHVSVNKRYIEQALAGQRGNVEFIEQYRDHLRNFTQPLRDKISDWPMQPKLKTTRFVDIKDV